MENYVLHAAYSRAVSLAHYLLVLRIRVYV